jgi:type III secretory pathway component EscR
MTGQNYKNHIKLVPLYHYVTYLLMLAALAGATLKFVRSYETGLYGLLVPTVLILLSVALILVAFFARSFALKAQDRAIRAEENLRYFAITGKLLDNKLTPAQIVALRFASNNEFVDLVHRALAENLSNKQIKQAIQHWKGDYHRV